MTKPPSRKHYEKSEVERLKEKIRQLETKTPEYKELEDRLEIARLNALTAQQYEREMKSALYHKQTIADWFDVLKRSEVMVLTPEGMKYLVGQDLEDFCKAEIEKQAQARTTMWDFKSFANQAINTIIRDEIDKAPLNQYQLDAYKYITKGRYDTGTKE